MKTVKEISKITGISVRTLHYYDEIGLLKPTDKSEAGYRLYDDKALEKLQQILFFREFDIPLKEIKHLMDDPAFDRNEILRMQRKMLAAKKERMERLIASMDDILKGDNQMDFEVFNKAELEELAQSMIDHMPDAMREGVIKDFGSVEAWRTHYLERASKPDIQKGYQKLVEWYGSKEEALKQALNPPSEEVVQSYQNRCSAIVQKLAKKKADNLPVTSFEVKELIGEYGFATRQLYQIKDERDLMLGISQTYKDERVRTAFDNQYGEGMADYYMQAVEVFYGGK